MQWKRFKPYRCLAFWTTAVLYGLCMINVPPAQTCQLPDERNDTGRFVARHLDQPALMASKTVFSLSLYPKCFAPVSGVKRGRRLGGRGIEAVTAACLSQL